MARKDSNRDFSPVIDAAQRWIKRSLVGDQSVFTEERLWTQTLAEELKRFFIDALDESDAKFIEKLERQLGSASQSSKQLMAEILWVLCLFPSNSRPATKRDQVVRVWGPGGQATIAGSPFMTDAVLSGIGSAGTAYHTHHWREVSYLILILLKFKPLSPQAREVVFASYKNLTDWLETLPESTNRQFPHMLGFFAFPEMVERISSSREKLRILKGFGVPAAKNWNHRKLDEELLALRKRLEDEFPGQPLDFYYPPLVTRWKLEEEGETVVNEDAGTHTPTPARTPSLPDSPTNLILYGPPGTGKTRALLQLQARYTETTQSQDRNAWLESIVANYGWREVIAVALAKLGPTNVPSIRQHELVVAKSRERQALKNLGSQVWGALQRHTPMTVITASRLQRT
jgi:5-methylcytosine-specific restriction protein B